MKKKLTHAPAFVIFSAHTVTTKQNMRTQTLLIAAAALVAGVISSEAQTPVYSANVVGYVNVSAQPGQFILVENPLTTGDDVISNVLQNLPGGTTAQIWNGAGFNSLTYSALSHTWKNGSINADNTPLPPGVGFFLQNSSAAITNTFVGSVVAASGGGTETNALSTSLTPVGSALPYADVVTNGATINLAVGGGSTLQQWSVSGQQFQTFTYSALASSWKLGSVNSNPVVNVAEGFFIQPSAATNWVQTLQ
ncbi:MAG TPA: hypothetical protein VGH42_14085 [Verrucomicrobiae bacterium]